jgi:DNA-binding MarR family transcriptional regulator
MGTGDGGMRGVAERMDRLDEDGRGPEAEPRDGDPAAIDAIDAAIVLEAVGYRLRRAHLLFVDHWNRVFTGLGLQIAPMQGGMLLLIDRNPGLSQIELGRVLGVEGSTMVQAIGRLTDMGLVQRYRLPDDRRRWALHLTRRGKQAVGVLEANLRRHEEELMSDFTAQEREAFSEMLGRLLRRGAGQGGAGQGGADEGADNGATGPEGAGR